MTTLSALVTVYAKIPPQQLRDALDSLVHQTRPADEIVLVADGPLTDGLEAVIADFAEEVQVVRLAKNRGAAVASQAGLDVITGEWLGRLDADDIAYPERFERQLDYIAAHPDVDVVGTAMTEFSTTPAQPQAVRRLPATSHKDIEKYAKLQSPVNNPSATMRVAAVKQAGGFRDVKYMEDYDLYARLLATGARFVNLPEPLTYFRVSDEQLTRRTSNMMSAEWQMQRNLVSYGLIGWPRAVGNFVLRSAYRALPRGLIKRVYTLLFHR